MILFKEHTCLGSPSCKLDCAIVTLVLLVRRTVRAMHGLFENLHEFIHLHTNVTVLTLAKNCISQIFRMCSLGSESFFPIDLKY